MYSAGSLMTSARTAFVIDFINDIPVSFYSRPDCYLDVFSLDDA